MPRLDISAPREPAWLGHSRGGLVSSTSRGLDPREGLGCLADEDGPYGLLLSHAVGCRQACLGTPVPRTPTVAPGPKVRSGLASRRSQGSSSEHRGPQKPAASVDAWRLIGRGRLRFPVLPLNPPGYAAPAAYTVIPPPPAPCFPNSPTSLWLCFSSPI